MKLHELFLNSNQMFERCTEFQSEMDLNFDISGLFFDARKVIQNSLFIAIQGHNHDGHNYIYQAIDFGSKVIIVEKTDQIPKEFKGLVFKVKSSREALDQLASSFYHKPSEKLFTFGVTGTNGKTSITYILEHILNYNHKLTGVMGTVNHRVGSTYWDSQLTTPDPVTLQLRLNQFKENNAFAAALEVSSHALDQNRVDSVQFNTVIFTNLTLDHLDYHKNMENYFQSKQKLFSDLLWVSSKKLLFAIVNIDDKYGRRLKICDKAVTWTYGQGDADFKFKILNMNFKETIFELQTPIEMKTVTINSPGVHTVYNIVAGLVAAITAGVTLDKAIESLKNFSGIPGRLEKIDNIKNKIVFVDYAHTPDALENSLKSILKIKAEIKSKAKVITVFGCGGDRDQTKRPLMCKIACENSDCVIITSDNPRSEDPNEIINQIKNGQPQGYKQLYTELDRKKAIGLALEMADAEDIVLIAGKGHENYQIIGNQKFDFSDKDVALNFLNERQVNNVN